MLSLHQSIEQTLQIKKKTINTLEKELKDKEQKKKTYLKNTIGNQLNT